MRIAIINESSAGHRNADIVSALEQVTDAQLLNVGMKSQDDQPQLTYIHTSYMCAMLLNADACDFVIGGCGTGQGFTNSALQFPGVFCGLVVEPLDAWLFSQINGGNCISLPLNKGYGWAGDINLKYIFEKLFADPVGQGYPRARAEIQAASRATLARLSRMTHLDMMEILKTSEPDVLNVLAKCADFMSALENGSSKGAEMAALLRNA